MSEVEGETMDQRTLSTSAADIAPQSPFELAEQAYLLLKNAEEKHSLWPLSCPVPAGWRIVYGPASRQECLKETT
jgi:uncharacterized protein YbdZ (MbtH family)